MISSERIYDAIRFDELRTIDPQSAVREAILVVQQLLILDNISPQENLDQMKNKVLTLKDIKTCPVCDKVFRSTSYLKHHMRVHTGERPYKCRLCPKDFPTKDTFKKHLLIHSGERSYKCGECGKLFKRISHAKEHLKIHSDERPYHCNICQKSFKTANIFKVHERTHTLYLPWVCKVCDKRFREKASLTRHIRTHTGEKPFQCKYCGKQFGEHGTLARHLRCKVPCSEALVEARLQKASDELTFDNVTLNREEGDKVRTYPTVLTEFSSVVTDTQEYMAPADQVNSSGGVDVSQLSTIEVRDDSTGGATSYIIVNEGDLQQLTSFTQQSAQMCFIEIFDSYTCNHFYNLIIMVNFICGSP
ncbi:hypothetical protein EB796_000632 [Bugula neritina]|uniref:C2H2-type domain-containing protein n=1 Tax=Bugula neritina TaxID=10212 RepID=A0A7J7KS89_BUGNE|nr:hypothetical protein EB796_000632 [Bugula neritina]